MSAFQCALTVTLVEDLHSGSGLGGEGVDALLARDCKGYPTIRWKTLKGTLRDALHGRQSSLHRPLDETLTIANRLFGDDPASLGVDARIGPRHGLIRGTGLRQSVRPDGLVWTSSARKVHERAPADDTMRQVEYLHAGTRLYGQLWADNEDAKKWLEVLLRRMNRLGKQKSRGSGLVQLQTKWELGKRTTNSKKATGLFGLRLRALDPVSFAAQSQPGNVIPTETHVPARSLHAALVEWALSQGDRAAASQLLRYEVLATAAYPGPFDSEKKHRQEHMRSIPLPLGQQFTKPPAQTGELPWWASPENPPVSVDTLGAKDPEKLKRGHAADYLTSSDQGATWQVHHQPVIEVAHNNAGQTRRKDSAKALYTVQSIPEETTFFGQLEASTAFPFDALSAAVLFIGRGRMPVRVDAVWPIKVAAAPVASGIGDEAGSEVHAFRLVLVSDLIARDATGATYAELSQACLIDAITSSFLADGRTPPRLPTATKVRSVSDSQVLHGYNFATRLPRMANRGVRRGSEMAFDGEGVNSWYWALQSVRPNGLGLRCFEGFGRFELLTEALQVTDGENVGLPPAVANADEEIMASVQHRMEQFSELLNAEKAFGSGRWQGLRNAVGDHNLRRAWLEATARHARKNSVRQQVFDDFKNWVGNPTARETRVIRAFAQMAARIVQDRKRGRSA